VGGGGGLRSSPPPTPPQAGSGWWARAKGAREDVREGCICVCWLRGRARRGGAFEVNMLEGGKAVRCPQCSDGCWHSAAAACSCYGMPYPAVSKLQPLKLPFSPCSAVSMAHHPLADPQAYSPVQCSPRPLLACGLHLAAVSAAATATAGARHLSLLWPAAGRLWAYLMPPCRRAGLGRL
jgi:hypothetical protein